MLDPVFSHCLYRHHNNGINPPHTAMALGDMLLRDLPSLSAETARPRMALACGMLRHALLLQPFDTGLRGIVNGLTPLDPVSEIYQAWLGACNAALDDTKDMDMHEAESERDRLETDADALHDTACAHASPALRHACVLALWKRGDFARFADAASAMASSATGPLVSGLYAYAAWAAGDAALCDGLLSRALINPLTMNLKAALAETAGESDTARTLRLRSLDALPVQTHLLLQLAGPESSAAARNNYGTPRVSILLQMDDTPESACETLRSLLAAEHGQAHIALLNNGGSTMSQQDIDTAVAAAAQGYPVEIVHLPTAVNAAAARNWLWQLEGAQQAEYVAFAGPGTFPRHWLPSLLQALQQHPQATLAGACALYTGTIPTMAQAARHLACPPEGHQHCVEDAPLFANLLQHEALKPSLSVTETCRVYNRAACERLDVPGFDIRLDSVQAASLEHDMQIWRKGGSVLLDGRVRITGRSPDKNHATDSVQHHADSMKIEMKLTQTGILEACTRAHEQDQHHLRRCVRSLLPELSSDTKKFLTACELV